jgi:flagellar hook-basal body complex protein FliE
MIESLAALGAIQSPSLTEQTPAARGGAAFVDWFDKELTQANQMIESANAQVQRFAAGEDVPVHQVMLALEEARLAFQVMAQVRNRLLESYQEVLRMQI